MLHTDYANARAAFVLLNDLSPSGPSDPIFTIKAEAITAVERLKNALFEQLEIEVEEAEPSGGSVGDPFLGSGTTLIAAEQLDRTCYGIEIEPRYVDVVVERWQNLTGGKARRSKG